MTEGVLDIAGLNQLVSDLRDHATVLSVREKVAPGVHAGADEEPLETAITRLAAGTARALQVRYWYDSHEWTDTVFALPSGYRVVRCRHEL
jgi:hypothetical protein